MNREGMWAMVGMAWKKLAGDTNVVASGRAREEPSPARGDEPALARDGFAEEALPWLDAVYRFAMRLTSGNRDAAEDLVQETYLKAYGAWSSFSPGTNAKSWLFTICRNAYLHEKDRLRSRRELSATDVGTQIGDLSATSVPEAAAGGPEADFFGGLIDDEVVRAIDELPDEFREVLILSDLGDLKYAEISEVLGMPIGTVKSRLFRGRRILQDRLRAFAARSGYLQDSGEA